MIVSILKNNSLNQSIKQKYQNSRISFGSTEKLLNQTSTILRIANNVSTTNLGKHLNILAGSETEGRGVGQKGIEIAKEYIAEEFEKYGLNPVKKLGLSGFFQNFIMSKYFFLKAMTSNVLGMIQGSEKSDEFLILSAHYDHLGIESGRIYPGADDNASGVSALLEIARIMAKERPPEKSVIFAALSAEESGQQGAEKLSSELLANGIKNKVEVLNFDMLGGLGGDHLDIWDQGLDNTGNLVTNLQEVGDILNIRTQIHHNTPISDAKRFNANNIPAICVAWDYYKPGNHPYLHSAEDTPESVNKKVLAEATRLLAAASYQIANKITFF